MAQSNAMFSTGKSEFTTLAVTYESVTGSYGVSMVAVNVDQNEAIYSVTFGAFRNEWEARDLFIKMNNAMEDKGYEKIEYPRT